jgi:replicative DNA helicase
MSERPVPANLDAERCVLASLFCQTKDHAAALVLSASDFSSHGHRLIYRAIQKLASSGGPVDIIAVMDELGEQLDSAGGGAYLGELLSPMYVGPDVSNCVRMIREKAILRELANLGEMAWGANGDASQVLARAKMLSARIEQGDQKPSPASSALKSVSIPDLIRLDVPDREMLLHPFLPTQGLALLYSKRGVGKTFLSLGISIAVASGSSFLKWAAPSARKVLYVDGEMPLSAIKQRILDINAGFDIGHPLDNLRIITPDLQDRGLPDLSTISGQDEIEEHLDGVTLLVLDNLSALVRAIKENEGEGWLPVQDWALDLRRRGISVLFVHHAGKSGAQRGTSRREDLLDSVLTLKHPSDYHPE